MVKVAAGDPRNLKITPEDLRVAEALMQNGPLMAIKEGRSFAGTGYDVHSPQTGRNWS